MKTRNVRRRQRLAYARRMNHRPTLQRAAREGVWAAMRPGLEVPPTVRREVSQDFYRRAIRPIRRRHDQRMARLAVAFRGMTPAVEAATPAIKRLLTAMQPSPNAALSTEGGPHPTGAVLDEMEHFMDAADLAQATDIWWLYGGTVEGKLVTKLIGPVTKDAGMPTEWGIVDESVPLVEQFTHEPSDAEIEKAMGAPSTPWRRMPVPAGEE